MLFFQTHLYFITNLQFFPLGQSESVQHSRHLLKGKIPQQFLEVQSESVTHLLPIVLEPDATHFRFL